MMLKLMSHSLRVSTVVFSNSRGSNGGSTPQLTAILLAGPNDIWPGTGGIGGVCPVGVGGGDFGGVPGFCRLGVLCADPPGDPDC